MSRQSKSTSHQVRRRRTKRQVEHDDGSNLQRPLKRQKPDNTAVDRQQSSILPTLKSQAGPGIQEIQATTPETQCQGKGLDSSDRCTEVGNVMPSPDLGVLPDVEPVQQDPIGKCSTQNHEEQVAPDTPIAHNTCFGAILAQASFMVRKGDLDRGQLPLTLLSSKGVLKLHHCDSQKQLGVVALPPIAKLLDELSLTVTASAYPPKRMASQSSISYILDRPQYVQMPVRIVLHGCLSEKAVVGKTLTDGQIFLQHPYESECHPGASYENPHYFLRPGASMPRLEDLHISSPERNDQRQQATDPLTDEEKSQLLSLFETAVEVKSGANIVKQSSRLLTKLKDHQQVALTLMAEKECGVPVDKAQFPQLWHKTVDNDGNTGYRHTITGAFQPRPPNPVRGGILADEMGLGKTLSTLALITWHLDTLDATMTNQPSRDKCADVELRTTLIVTPKSTIHEWTQQVYRHTAPNTVRLLIYHGNKTKKAQLGKTLKDADIVLTTYDTLRSEYDSDSTPAHSLLAQTWARIVLDEAHTIRNRTSKIFHIASNVLRSPRRWCLTGTPIQNSLDDFGSLLTFIRAKPFHTAEDFSRWISKPFKNREKFMRFRDRGEEEGDYMLARLRRLVSATCLRRTKKGLLEQGNGAGHSMRLPGKREIVEELELDAEDMEVYQFFKKNAVSVMKNVGRGEAAPAPDGVDAGDGNDTLPELEPRNDVGRSILPLIGILRLICNHGADLLSSPALRAWREKDNKAVDLHLVQDTANRCRICGIVFEELLMNGLKTAGASRKGLTPCVRATCPSCSQGGDGSTSDPIVLESDDEVGETFVPDRNTIGQHPARLKSTKSPPWALAIPSDSSSSSSSSSRSATSSPGLPIDENPTYRPSAKVRALLRNLEKEQTAGNGITKSVVFSYWTRMLDLIERAFREKSIPFQRMDGQTTLDGRIKALREFDGNPACRVLLASIGSMSVGVNLTVANSVHIIEPQWNPMVETQATDRVHRIGQTQEVTVTRYYIKQSIETYVRCVQEDKLRLIRQSLSSGKQQSQAENSERHWKVLVELLHHPE